MTRITKTLLLGLIVWVIPFLSSFFVWDVKANAPSIDIAWFYALMSLTGILGFSIAAYYQFKDNKNPIKNGWITGITWYLELILLDFIFLVLLFNMSLSSYSHLLMTYLTPLVLCVLIGYLKK